MQIPQQYINKLIKRNSYLINMLHQRTNFLLFVGLLFWFPVVDGQNNLRRVGHSGIWNIVLITDEGILRMPSLYINI